MKYAINNNLTYYIPLSPLKTLMLKNTHLPRTMFAWYTIDQNDGVWKGLTRESIFLYNLNYTTGEYIYPDGVPPDDSYWIESCIRDFNIGWIIFMVGMAIRVLI